MGGGEMNKKLYEAKLLAFLKDWLAWAEVGLDDHPSPDGIHYSCNVGLCSNSLNHPSFSAWAESAESPIEAEWGWGYGYPFGESDYDYRNGNGTQHKCPKRLVWVKNRIKELEHG